MSDSERERLAENDADLADKSAVLSPESFSQYLGHKLRGIKDPEPGDGLSHAERQAKAAWLELERAFDGMWQLRGQLGFPGRVRPTEHPFNLMFTLPFPGSNRLAR